MTPVFATPLALAIVEDDSRYRHSLETLFRHTPEFTLVGSFATAEEALERLQAEQPKWQVLLMDIALPGRSGIETTRQVKRLSPTTLVVMLTVFEEPATILEAICAGADGYLLKKASPQELVQQLLVVAAGGGSLTPGIARTVLDLLREQHGAQRPLADVGLSPRELDVLRELTRGLAYKQVAAELGVSIDTVRTHIRGVYRKLQVHSVAEAVGRAIRERLV